MPQSVGRARRVDPEGRPPDVADPAQFSRPWFAWANSLFGELMLTVAAQRRGVFRLLDG